MANQRLPTVNGDDGQWGTILNHFLEKEHYNTGVDSVDNGGHKTITIRAGTTAAGTAPLKFTTGPLMTTPEAGAFEFSSASDKLLFTHTTGTARKVILTVDATGATGDVYYRDSSSNFAKLAIGSTDDVLTVAGGLPVWSPVDPTLTTSTKTTNYTIVGTDVVIFADATSGNTTITLPAAASFSGYSFYVKRIDGSVNTCVVGRSGGDTIDGATSFALDAQYYSIKAVSNGTNWYII